MNLVKAKIIMSGAEAFANLSTCPKGDVGVIILDKYGKSVSFGYNGAPSGARHCDDVGCQEIDGHCSTAVHAEMNALLFGDTERMRDGSIFISSDTPCYTCALAIVQAKLTNLYTGAPNLLNLKEDRFHTTELIIDAVKKGIRFKEVPVTVMRRRRGKTKKPRAIKYGWNFLKTILKTWWRD